MDSTTSTVKATARHGRDITEGLLALLVLATLLVELNYVREHADLLPPRVLHSAPVWIFTIGAVASVSHVALALSLHPRAHRRTRLAKVAAVIATGWSTSALTAGAFLTPNPAWPLLIGAGTATVLWVATSVIDRRARTMEQGCGPRRR